MGISRDCPILWVPIDPNWVPVNSSHGQLVTQSPRHTVNSSQSIRHTVNSSQRSTRHTSQLVTVNSSPKTHHELTVTITTTIQLQLQFRGVATGWISVFIPPLKKSAQVNFLWGKNDVRMAIQQFYTPKKLLYLPETNFWLRPCSETRKDRGKVTMDGL